jgi:phosphopantetheine adenylyltransferase
MGKIDELDNAVDHRIAKGDEGVNATDVYAVEQLTQKQGHPIQASSIGHMEINEKTKKGEGTTPPL